MSRVYSVESFNETVLNWNKWPHSFWFYGRPVGRKWESVLLTNYIFLMSKWFTPELRQLRHARTPRARCNQHQFCTCTWRSVTPCIWEKQCHRRLNAGGRMNDQLLRVGLSHLFGWCHWRMYVRTLCLPMLIRCSVRCLAIAFWSWILSSVSAIRFWLKNSADCK